MSILDRAQAALGRPTMREPIVAPNDVRDALRRGRAEMLKDAPKRKLCARFERGDTYWYVDSKGFLANQATALDLAGGKPAHRIRNTYNHIRPLIEDKVSSATSRIPSYEVVASTDDPDDRSAAGLAQKVALYGYDQWRMRRKRMKVVKTAVGQGGRGFAYPYFDPSVGPFREVAGSDPDAPPEMVGEGEVRILTLGGNEVYWEVGVEFEDSRWYAIERAVPIDEVKKIPGFYGELSPDATTSDIATDAQKVADGKLVMLTDYFERPCPRYVDGRRIRLVAERVIVDRRIIDPMALHPWEDYPLTDADGKVLDEPCIHRLQYTIDPETDDDLGLTWQLIDAQRTIQDCVNKLLEWKNRCLNPQLVAAVGSLIDQVNDEPGFVNYYRQGFDPPKWQATPQIPRELFEIVNLMRDMMQFFASYADAQAGPDVAAKTVGAVIEHSQARWQSFLGDLAEFDSRLMRHCLLLVARYYTEPRLLKINGWFGPDRVEDFQGAQLKGQVDVTVMPGSLTQLSKGEMLNRLQWIVQNFPGYLSPEMALAALDGGAAASMVRSYELDVAKIGRVIMEIRNGTILQNASTRTESGPDGQPLMIPAPIDPLTGAPPVDEMGMPLTVEAQVPSYMPMRDVDNLQVWRRQLGDWMKTTDYERTRPDMQEVAKQILTAINALEAEAAMKQAAQQAALAEGQGMANAVKPAGPKPLPDAAGPGGPS